MLYSRYGSATDMVGKYKMYLPFLNCVNSLEWKNTSVFDVNDIYKADFLRVGLFICNSNVMAATCHETRICM